jgi:hypothetical protein
VVVTAALLVPLAVFGTPAIAQSLSAAHQYGSACGQYGSSGNQYGSSNDEYGSAGAQYGPSGKQYGHPSPSCRQYRVPFACHPLHPTTSASEQYAKKHMHWPFCGKSSHGKGKGHHHGHGHGKRHDRNGKRR